MNNAHQLLNRAMNVLELEGVDWLAKEIRAYLAEPEVKPLTAEDIANHYLGTYQMMLGYEAFFRGVRFAEKHHGIGGGE